MSVVFHHWNDLPADLVDFWRERQDAQDRIMALTAGPEWFAMMAEGSEPAAVVAAVRNDRGALMAVLPLLFADWRFGLLPGKPPGRKTRSVKVCGGDIIENSVTPAQLAEAWNFIGNQCLEIDAVWFDHIGSESRMKTITQSCSCGRGWFVYRLCSGMPHYRLVLPGTLEEFRELRSADTLKKMECRERALRRLVNGSCRLVEIRGESDWMPYATGIEHVMNSAWQARLLGRSFSLGDLAQVAEKGRLRAFLLLAGDVAVAFAVCYQGNETLVYETIGYDQDYAKYSPGTILLYRMIEHVYFENRPKYVDFGEGEADYKSQLANDIITVDTCLVARRRSGLVGLLYLHRLCRRADDAGRTVLNMAGLRQWLAKQVKKKRHVS